MVNGVAVLVNGVVNWKALVEEFFGRTGDTHLGLRTINNMQGALHELPGVTWEIVERPRRLYFPIVS